MKYLSMFGLISVLALTACGDGKEQSSKWQHQEPSQSIQTVGVDDAQAILGSAGLKATKVTDSTDNSGDPKKIYIINDGITAQLEHSKNEVVLAWYQAEDAVEASQTSLNNTYLLAQAMLGKQGVALVNQVSDGKIVKQETVGGYSVSGSCSVNPCVIRVKNPAK